MYINNHEVDHLTFPIEQRKLVQEQVVPCSKLIFNMLRHTVYNTRIKGFNV